MEIKSLELPIDLNKIKQELEVHFVLVLPLPQEASKETIKVETTTEKVQTEPERKFSCPHCSKSFMDRRGIWQHQRTHEPKVKCQICCKEVRRMSLKNHVKRLHESDKNFRCDFCTEACSYKSSLENHMCRHREARKFNCKDCSRGFTQNCHYKEHLLTHDDPRPYKCDLCPKSCKTKRGISDHILILHDKDTWFKCKECEFETKSPYSLSYHQGKHKMKYKCDPCEKIFSRRVELERHKKRKHRGKHNTKKYDCSMCSREYKVVKYFNSHLRRVHGMMMNTSANNLI